MRAARFALIVLAALAIGTSQAQEPYRADSAVSGTIRIWGHPYMAGVVKAWAEGFARFRHGVGLTRFRHGVGLARLRHEAQIARLRHDEYRNIRHPRP